MFGGQILDYEAKRIKMEGVQQGIQIGEERGEERGRKSVVEIFKDWGRSQGEAAAALIQKFGLSEDSALKTVDKYWG